MEFPLMNTITGFESGITQLQDPSFCTRLLNLSGFRELYEIFKFYSFWTWSALLLATIATFTSILHRTILSFFRLRSEKSSISEPLIRFDTDPDDETCSISSDSDCDELPSTFKTNNFLGDEDFRVSNSNKFEFDGRKNRKVNRLQGFSSEDEEDDFFSGGVVKLWNEFGFGFEKSSGLISMLDLNKGEILRSFLGGKGQLPAITMPSPAVVVSAGVENMRNVAMRIWDARVGCQIPAAVAEWQPSRRRVVGIDSGGLEKVYVREDGGSVVVRDMRNLGSPLQEMMTDSDGQTWFDADAVMVGDGEGLGFDGGLTGKGGGSVVTRCRNAMMSYLF